MWEKYQKDGKVARPREGARSGRHGDRVIISLPPTVPSSGCIFLAVFLLYSFGNPIKYPFNWWSSIHLVKSAHRKRARLFALIRRVKGPNAGPPARAFVVYF